MSSMVPRSTPYDYPVWPLFKLLTAPFSLIQPCTGAPFKGDLSVVERWARYHNDQDSELSSLVSRSSLYDCPPYGLHSSLLQPHSNPHSKSPFKGDNFPMQHHKIHQNVQLNKQRKMHPSRPSKHSQQTQSAKDYHLKAADKRPVCWCLWRNWTFSW